MEKDHPHRRHISPKEVFMHFMAMITLYVLAGSFLTLIFQLVNITLPDPLFSQDIYYGADANLVSYGRMRFAIASLIIVLPVFLVTSWFLNRSYRADHESREVSLRKWLIHFTLFVSALIMGGDLISLVLGFLEGELTLRFSLKALSLLIVAGTIFGYYVWDVRRDTPSVKAKLFAIPMAIIVLGFMITGLVVMGSPTQARYLRLDADRVSDLDTVQNELLNYWRQKETLPQRLSDLERDFSYFTLPVDPESGEPYEYAKKDDFTFTLCANFRNASTDDQDATQPRAVSKELAVPGYSTFRNWQHASGHVCFERTIDPDVIKEQYP